jgi:hypothetical protein
MWAWRRVEEMRWTERKSNEEVVGEDRKLHEENWKMQRGWLYQVVVGVGMQEAVTDVGMLCC